MTGDRDARADGPRVIVVGGGASGLAAAIGAARRGARVRVLEAGRRVGRSILASGNGRCNFTNRGLAPDAFNDPAYFAAAFGAHPLDDVLAFFDGLGLWYREEAQGRLYPRSRTAASVLDLLLGACQRLGVDVQSQVTARTARPAAPQAGWVVSATGPDGRGPQGLVADAVVWAAGGGSAGGLCADLGLRHVPERPVLCPLATNRDGVAGLDGVRAACGLRVLRDERDGAGGRRRVVFADAGEVLFRPYGISGIVTFDASRLALPGDVVEMDLMPDVGEDDLQDRLADRAARARAAGAADPAHFLDGVLHPALALHVMRDVCGRDGATGRGRGAGGAGGVDVGAVARRLKHYALEVRGTADEAHAQVTRGGIATDEVDPATMAVRGRPGLFACGEAMDMDAACGGFNLSWAWLSGLRAGSRAADVRA